MIITIKNNREYCAEKKLVTKKVVPCGCIGFANGLRQPGGDDNCTKCCGLGFSEKDYYPFELVTGTKEFSLLWKMLGFPAEKKGEMYPSRFQSALKGFPKSCDKRKYLTELCTEAARREEKIVWE